VRVTEESGWFTSTAAVRVSVRWDADLRTDLVDPDGPEFLVEAYGRAVGREPIAPTCSARSRACVSAR
jgi:hypothetical protein